MTFSDVHPMTVEINLMDFNRNIYGEVVNVNWLSYLRSEIKFQTPEDLIDQLDKDKTATREYLQQHPEVLN